MAKVINCYYGQSGTGKSTAVLERALAHYKHNKATTRVVIGDGGVATYLVSGLVGAGVIEICEYADRPYPLTVMQRLAQGWWLKDPADPLSDLIAPAGGWAGVGAAGVGLYVFEGLSVGGKYVMGLTKGGLAERAGRGEKIGQDSPISIKDEGGVITGGNPLAHYNVGQNVMLQCVQSSKGFPGEVIWTAHEAQGSDKTGGEKLIGPEVVGQALTASVSRVFGDTLHFVTADKALAKVTDAVTKKQVQPCSVEYRIYTRDHYDPDGLTFTKFKAVTRCPLPAEMPDYFASPADDPGKGIRDFYTKLKAIETLNVQKRLAE